MYPISSTKIAISALVWHNSPFPFQLFDKIRYFIFRWFDVTSDFFPRLIDKIHNMFFFGDWRNLRSFDEDYNFVSWSFHEICDFILRLFDHGIIYLKTAIHFWDCLTKLMNFTWLRENVRFYSVKRNEFSKNGKAGKAKITSIGHGKIANFPGTWRKITIFANHSQKSVKFCQSGAEKSQISLIRPVKIGNCVDQTWKSREFR